MDIFPIENHSNYTCVRFPMVLQTNDADAFLEASKEWLKGSCRAYVLDFKGVEKIAPGFYRAIIQFRSQLKKENKALGSVNLHVMLLKQITVDGLDMSFHPVRSVQELLIEAGVATAPASPPPTINVEVINPFINGTIQTLEVQCQTKVRSGKPSLKGKELEGAAIAGVLSIQSNEFNGNIVLCFTQAAFLKVCGGMFGETYDTITSELEDAAGELLNIIYGMAKAELNPKGFTFQTARPTVLVGEKMRIRQTGPGPTVVVPFETDGGPFRIEIELNPN